MDLGRIHGLVAEAHLAPGCRQDAYHNQGIEPALARAARDLAGIGFAGPGGPESAAGSRPLGETTEDEWRLLRLLARWNLTLQLGKGLDGNVDVALIAWDPEADPASARGNVFSGVDFSARGAVRKCLGEFAEFVSWLYRPGDAGAKGPADALPGPTLDPWAAIGFSGQQVAERVRLNAEWDGYDSIPQPDEFDGPSEWTPVRRPRDGMIRWAPTQICFGRYCPPGRSAARTWRSDSNGCAAGRSPAAAREAALFELMERDATGLWWYGRLARPGLDWRDLAEPQLAEAMAAREQPDVPWLLDLTTEFAVPVVAALVLDRDARIRAAGFASGRSYAAAARSAYLELCQMELSLALVQRRRLAGGGGPAADMDRALLDWRQRTDLKRLPHLRPSGTRRAEALHVQDCSPESLLERLSTAGFEVYALDLTRPDIEIPATRLLAPGLCHYKPRLGVRRLLSLAGTLQPEPLRL